MREPALSHAITAATDELAVEVATTSAQLLEAQRLRYRVYCEERGFEPGANGLEADDFDPHARHILVRSRITGAILGTVRVVLPRFGKGHQSFPMSRVCEKFVLAPLPSMATGEISRFALTRDRTGVSNAAAALMRLCLMKGIVDISGQSRLTHWCAIMETSLLRLLRSTAIHFQPVGPTVEFHGVRQPAIGAIETVLGRILREQPAVWAFITGNGGLWSAEAARVQAFG